MFGRTMKAFSLFMVLILVIGFAGCKNGDSSGTTTELSTEYAAPSQSETVAENTSETYSEIQSEIQSETYSETEYNTPETLAPTETPQTLPPETEAIAPVATGDVVINNGTRGGILTFHMDSGTYDLYVPSYYLSTGDIPALKVLLKFKSMIPEEAKPYITTENGYDALGPVEISFEGDTFSVSGATLTFANSKSSRVEIMPDWGDLPYCTPSATANSSGMTVTFIIKGGDGKYDCPISTFVLTVDECRAIGLTV